MKNLLMTFLDVAVVILLSNLVLFLTRNFVYDTFLFASIRLGFLLLAPAMVSYRLIRRMERNNEER